MLIMGVKKMVFARGADRRKKTCRRKRVALANFPFFDGHGEPVLWERRSKYGRRRTDFKHRWTRKDIPGFALMGILFVILALTLFWLWKNSGLLIDP